MSSKNIVCRCEEVTEEEIREAISFGAKEINEIKRLTRAGMGFCQGSTCYFLIKKMLQQENSKVQVPSVRPPLKPVSLDDLAGLQLQIHKEQED